MPGVCPRCHREVYFAEERLALGKVWHTFCFSCRNCRKLLDSCTVATHCGELFCKNCYVRLFPPTNRSFPSPCDFAENKALSSSPNPATVFTSDSLSDCCCCCCCAGDCIICEEVPLNQKEGQRPNRRRRRGGGGEEEEETQRNQSCLEHKPYSDSECTNLDVDGSVATICNPPSSPIAVTTWYNRQHSASQSNEKRPVSRLQEPQLDLYEQKQDQQYQQQESIEGTGSEKLASCAQSHLSTVGNQTTPVFESTESKPPPQSLCKSESALLTSRRKPYTPQPPPRSPLSRRRVSFYEASLEDKSIDDCGLAIMQNDRDNLNPDHDNTLNIRKEETYDVWQASDADKNDNQNASDNDESENDDNHDTPLKNSSNHACDVEQSKTDVEDENRLRGGCGGGSKDRFPEKPVFCCAALNDDNFDDVNQNPIHSVHSVNSPEAIVNDNDLRMRGGHGGCCRSSQNPKSEFQNKAITDDRCGCSRQECSYTSNSLDNHSPPQQEQETWKHESIHDSDPCRNVSETPYSGVACSSPCSDRQDCCLPAGYRPVCKKTSNRCHSPCTGENQGCGGGGCCGSGCRGGCGKPGQICLPARMCTLPPCRPHPPGITSPCSPSRSCAPQPPCCRKRVANGSRGHSGVYGTCDETNGGSSCCRSQSPRQRIAEGGGCYLNDGGKVDTDGCFQTKRPPGCECLGGGFDCQRCGRKVYQAEMQTVSGAPYHNICFSCFCCRKPLEPLTYQENCGEIYCKQCYVRNFGPQGYGYGMGAGVLQTPM